MREMRRICDVPKEQLEAEMRQFAQKKVGSVKAASIIRKSKFPWFPERSVQFSGKRTKRSVQKKGCTQHL